VLSLRNAQGVVYAEFIFSFVPLFLLFLGGVQLALIAQARIVVQHAASQAARAAVVRIDDDPIFYEDGKRKVLSVQGKKQASSRQRGPLQIVETLTATTASSDNNKSQPASGSGRLNAIRNAAYLPLSAIGPLPLQGLASGSHNLSTSTGGTPLLRILNSLALYGRTASAVTFPRTKEGDALRSFEQPWSDSDTVYVRVTYLFHCSVPLVRRFTCRSLAAMHGSEWLSQIDHLFSRSEAAKDPTKQRLEELKHAEWANLQKALTLQVDEQFIALRGEAALPNQGAGYRYPSELCKTKERAPEVDCKGGP
jgi:Flp pilus assembly protein TadG